MMISLAGARKIILIFRFVTEYLFPEKNVLKMKNNAIAKTSVSIAPLESSLDFSILFNYW